VVEAVAPDVKTVKVGDRVAWMHILGTYAEYAVAPVSRLILVPEGVSTQQAAAAMLQGMTAHYLAYACYVIKPNRYGAGACGRGRGRAVADPDGERVGARVLTTVSSEEKQRWRARRVRTRQSSIRRRTLRSGCAL